MQLLDETSILYAALCASCHNTKSKSNWSRSVKGVPLSLSLYELSVVSLYSLSLLELKERVWKSFLCKQNCAVILTPCYPVTLLLSYPGPLSLHVIVAAIQMQNPILLLIALSLNKLLDVFVVGSAHFSLAACWQDLNVKLYQNYPSSILVSSVLPINQSTPVLVNLLFTFALCQICSNFLTITTALGQDLSWSLSLNLACPCWIWPDFPFFLACVFHAEPFWDLFSMLFVVVL